MKKLRLILFLLIGLACVGGIGAWLVLTGRWAPNGIVANVYPVRGIDISHHQGTINWRAVATDHVDFAFMKATEGTDFVDKNFAGNWKAAASHGIARGAYHFYSPATRGQDQARHFVSTVPAESRALPPVVDLEFAVGAIKVAKFRAELEQFLAILRKAYGKEPIVYTTEEFRSYYLREYPVPRLWIREVVLVPSSPTHWLFWQYSSVGRVKGISGAVDLNVFRQGIPELEAITRGK